MPTRRKKSPTTVATVGQQKEVVSFTLREERIPYDIPAAVNEMATFTPENPGPNNRQSEWVPKFLEVLAFVGTIGTACQQAGISRKSYERLMKESPDFREAVAWAQKDANDRLAFALWQRGHEGVTQEKGIWGTKRVKGADGKVEVVPFKYGSEIKTEYSDTAAIFLLKARDPDTYSDRQRVISETSPSLKDVLLEMARQRGIDPQAALEGSAKFLEDLRRRKELGLA